MKSMIHEYQKSNFKGVSKKILPLLLLLTGVSHAQIVDIPDEYFKAKLLEANATISIAMDVNGNNIKVDTNNDGQIQETEALTVYKLRVLNSTIFDLAGISSFTNLRELDCSGNILFTLDASALTNLTQLNCGTNFLQTLNVSGLTNLTNLFCPNNRLASITGLSGLANLTRLFCSNNRLPNLDMTGSPDLQMLICQTNLMTSLNVTGLSDLTLLMCNGNKLPSINLTGLTGLTSLEIGNNELTSLNLAPATSLVSLNCFYNQLTSLDLTQSTGLTYLNCGENNITTLNLNGLVNLNALECSYLPNNVVINGANLNALNGFGYTGSNTAITLNGFPSLEGITLSLPQPVVTLNLSGLNDQCDIYLINSITTSLTVNGTGTTHIRNMNFSNNQLTSLSLNGISNLDGLICNSNKLTSLNLTNLASLTRLEIGRNKIANLNLSNVPNLKYLNCSNNKLTSVDIAGLSALEHLDVSNSYWEIDPVGNQITSLNIGGLTHLKYLDCSNYGLNGQLGALGNVITSLDVANLADLEYLKCSKNSIDALSLNGLANMIYLDCSLNGMNSLDLIGLTNLTHLNYTYNNLSSLNMTGLVNITQLYCAYNDIETLTVNNMPNLKNLDCSHNPITDLNLSGLTQLISLNCSGNPLAADLDLSATPNLEGLFCNSSNQGALDLSGLHNLKGLDCNNNHISVLELGNNPLLESLYCANNLLEQLEVSHLTNLYYLQCDSNSLAFLNVSPLTNLIELSCSSNDLTQLSIGAFNNLRTLSCNDNAITALDLSQTPNLIGVYCYNNALQTLDVSNATRLSDLWCNGNPALASLYMKNGSFETALNVSDNPLLTYICADDMQLASVQSQLNASGMTWTVSNSYCSFTPGGPHNTVVGTTIFDGNNNGCNLNDPLHPNIRIDITNTDTSTTGSAFTNSEGNCTFYTEAGNYTIFPNIENAAAFNISPAEADINFPNNNNNVNTQSFCLSANGVHPDLEIVVTAIGPTRPGFDSGYKIVYKNKGNQSLSGTIALLFEDDKIDLISALPAADSQTDSNLNWAYNNLLPFESRSIDLVFNVNSPTETPPVNNDDILSFTTSITPIAGDELPLDNQFSLGQIVVGPFDPNQKTCLEGDEVSPGNIGKYLHYNIEFENLGTAAATNVVVQDVINTDMFDINSLQVLQSSHNVLTSIRGNVVEFIFKNINLAPSQGDPPVNGHGNILFKIKTLPTLENGSHVENTANIYFDYNTPIETNTARTTFSTLSTPEFDVDESVVVYPNPANDFINIKCNSTIKSVELYDVQGRLLQTVLDHKTQTKLNIADKANGMYFVRIITENGKRIEQIIKQ